SFIVPTAQLKQNREATGTIYDVVDHIDYLAKHCGVKHVGIGSDYDGVPRLPDQLESVAAYPRITQLLLERGYDRAAIHAILGGNVLRVLREAESVSATLKAAAARQ
ncbi:MAG TPA: membrane dipeptidase, partial [Planctomycetaceae bacterium]|nr:membrane dipeptidase [Planctomycetaceae bacterium]